MTENDKEILRKAQTILSREEAKYSTSDKYWHDLWDAQKTIQQVLEDNGEPRNWSYCDG